MSKIPLPSTPEKVESESRERKSEVKVENQSREPEKVDGVQSERKTSEAQLRAIAKYEREKVKRINCRIPLELWDKMQETGVSANNLIIKALEQYLA